MELEEEMKTEFNRKFQRGGKRRCSFKSRNALFYDDGIITDVKI
jgi:hypothetical protein